MQQKNIADFTARPFFDIDKGWMLVTAGDRGRFNTMTASWGALGTLWNRPAATIYVRPVRYTYEFLENNEIFTLSLFEAGACRPALSHLGTASGRDGDKLAGTGLTPVFTDGATPPFFAEARAALVCRKIYWSDIDPAHFLADWIGRNYPEKDYHRMYVGEVLQLWG
ncbi:MAG: flavin reductase family protein [Oscillospiraceae bacterium]|nr:flavin reductase family protein [Oscillospiraceae bacterium]